MDVGVLFDCVAVLSAFSVTYIRIGNLIIATVEVSRILTAKISFILQVLSARWLGCRPLDGWKVVSLAN